MKKALILFGNEVNRENLLQSAISLQKLGFTLSPLYIKDISRDKMMVGSEGIAIMGRTPLLNNSWIEVEKLEVAEINKLLSEYSLPALEVEMGIPNAIVTQKMKNFDILVMGKNILNDNNIAILKDNYKAILLIGEKPLVSLDNILIGNDDGVKVNKSCYQFIHLFPEIKQFTSMAINKQLEDNILVEYLKNHEKNIVHQEFSSSNYNDIIQEVDKFNLFIMGNLSKSYFFEKIIGKNGVKLLENVKTPVFIG